MYGLDTRVALLSAVVIGPEELMFPSLQAFVVSIFEISVEKECGQLLREMAATYLVDNKRDGNTSRVGERAASGCEGLET